MFSQNLIWSVGNVTLYCFRAVVRRLSINLAGNLYTTMVQGLCHTGDVMVLASTTKKTFLQTEVATNSLDWKLTARKPIIWLLLGRRYFVIYLWRSKRFQIFGCSLTLKSTVTDDFCGRMAARNKYLLALQTLIISRNVSIAA